MAIEDFEWEGDVERALPTQAPLVQSAREAESWLSRLKLPEGSQPLLAALGTSWLKPTTSAAPPAGVPVQALLAGAATAPVAGAVASAST